MRIACIGVGQAGGKITDTLLEWDASRDTDVIEAALAMNTAAADLAGLEYVPESNRVLYGKAEVNGNGVGADNELGTHVAQQDSTTIMNAINQISGYKVDAFLLVGGLGGGTGSGGLPVIARELRQLYTEPVYGLGILPSSDEGSIYTLNAARSFQTVVSEVDNLILFDNDAWRETTESVSGGYRTMNTELVRRLNVLFSAGQVDTSGSPVAENVVDASEIINTLDSGGVSTIGYATAEVDDDSSSGLLGSVLGDDTDDVDESHSVNRLHSLTRKATLGRLTTPAAEDTTERALAVYSGPPPYLSRKGIERGRSWLKDELQSMEVRGGDNPVPESEVVSACVLLSGVTDVSRIRELQKVAVETKENREDIREGSEAELASLVEDEGGQLDPLFE